MEELVMVLGGGVMGRGIAQAAAQAGLQVVLKELSPDLAAKALASIRNSLERAVERGKIMQAEKDGALARIKAVNSLDAAAAATVVIEAVLENAAKKKELLGRVAGVVPAHALIATNTSALSVSELATAVSAPERFLGLHFFNPVPSMKLVEVVRGLCTSDATMRLATAFVERLGKTPVTVKDTPGFLVNRLLIPMINEAAACVGNVAESKDIDTAMTLGAGYPMGPLALADMIGLDIVLGILETLVRELGEAKYQPCALLKQLVRQGKLGRKTGNGFFDYTAAR